MDNLKVLDGIRGLSALYVLIHHARLMLTQSYQTGLAIHPEYYKWFDKFMVYFFSLFKFGHEAVIIFFVLSGFVIHLKQARADFNMDRFSSLTYLKKRIIRIYPTLLVSFLLCILADFIIYSFITADETIFRKYTFLSFIYNLLLIPEAPIWGENYPIWSLKHEWFFYLAYPFLLWVSNKSYLLQLVIVVSLFASYLLGVRIPFIGPAAYTLLVWNLGVVMAYLYQRNPEILSKYAPYLVLILLVYPLINRIDKNYPLLDLLFGLVTVGFLVIVITNKIAFISNLFKKMASLGTFSYSLYLLHMPFLIMYRAYILHNEKDLPYHLWYTVLACILTVPVIYLIYLYTEKIAINYKQKALNT